MSSAQVTALVRQLLTGIGGFVVGAGYIDAANYEAAAGAVAILVGLSWSMWASRKAGVVTAASKIDSVEQIRVSPASTLSDKVASDKVVNSI